MNRLKNCFLNKKNQVLSIFFTAGFPNLEDTLPIIQYLSNAGVDIIEIGFPFSDPLADGPIIQNSNQIAIKNGMNLKLLFQQLKNVREYTQIPLILMGYLNPILQFGIKEFFENCSNIGIDGLILPDMPLEYYQNHFKNYFESYNIANIFLITPQTSSERIHLLDKITNGFLYVVSSNTVTGGNSMLENQITYFQRIQSYNLQNPTLIGFGIHNKKTFDFACQFSHGAIIGSAFIQFLKNSNGVNQNNIREFVQSIKI